MRVGIVAPSSVVGQVELELGLEKLRAEGFDIVRHDQCAQEHFTFAGTDAERAAAIMSMANDPNIDVIWAARGGYGAARLLPILERVTSKPLRKLLVGYSDITVLHEFVRRKWKWSTLHAPMPAADLAAIKPGEWQATIDLVNRRRPALSYENPGVTFINNAPSRVLRGELIGGNLSLWASLMGTPWQPDARGKFVFLEDLGEPFYRIDRMLTQVVQACGLDGALGLVLGDFTDCNDETNMALRPPTSDEERRRILRDRAGAPRISLRKVYEQPAAFQEIFGRLGVPVAVGLPVGHGPNFSPLPLGATYELTPEGSLRLVDWDWLSAPPPPTGG